MKFNGIRFLFSFVLIFCLQSQAQVNNQAKSHGEILGPCAIAATGDGRFLYVANMDSRQVCIVDISTGRVIDRMNNMAGVPTGLVLSPCGKHLFVTCADPTSTIAVIDTVSFKHIKSIPVGHTAMGPCISPDGRRLYVCNRFDDDVSVIDLVAGEVISRVKVTRQPVKAVVTPDGRSVVVLNHLPLVPSDEVEFSSVVTVINSTSLKTTEIPLIDGAINLRDVCISSDSRYAFVTHTVGNHTLATIQISQGWINTSALSVVDLKKNKFDSNAILDSYYEGAADPWGLALLDNGKKLCVAHSGTHEVSIIDISRMLKAIRIFGQYTGPMGGESLIKECRQRIKLPGKGPRDVVVSGSKIFVAEYFSDTIASVDLTGKLNVNVNGSEKVNTPGTINLRPGVLAGVLALLQKVGNIIRKHVSAPMPALIKKLKQSLRGWANYHRHVVASKAFSKVDTYVFEQLWRMLRRRHSNKSKNWLVRKYWTASGHKYVFAVKGKTKKGPRLYQVIRVNTIGIKRHIKIKADANPYLPEFRAYFYKRWYVKESKLFPALSAREFDAMFANR